MPRASRHGTIPAPPQVSCWPCAIHVAPAERTVRTPPRPAITSCTSSEARQHRDEDIHLRGSAAMTALVAGVAGTAAAYAGALPDRVQEVAHVMVGAPAPHHGGPQRPAVPAPRPDTQPVLRVRPASPDPGRAMPGKPPRPRARPGPPGRVTGQPKAATGRPAAALTTRRQARTSQAAGRTIQASQRRRRHAARPPRPAVGRPVTEA